MEPTIAQCAAWISLLRPGDPRRRLFDSGAFSIDALTGWACEGIGDMARLMIGRTRQLPIDFAMDAAAGGLDVTYQTRAVFSDGSQLSLGVAPLEATPRRLRIV